MPTWSCGGLTHVGVLQWVFWWRLMKDREHRRQFSSWENLQLYSVKFMFDEIIIGRANPWKIRFLRILVDARNLTVSSDKSSYTIWWKTWLGKLMKDVTTCEKFRRSGSKIWTGNFWMRLRIRSERTRNWVNWNVLVTQGREINWDAVSKGDRKQHRANRIPAVMRGRCGVWTIF